MNKKFTFIVLFLSICTTHLSAQENLPEFGVFSNEEVVMQESPLLKEAEAVILLDQAYAHYGDQYELITERRVRIKILNNRGLDKATIKIPFYTRDGFEYIREIQGVTYNADENDLSRLSKKSIYTEKIDGRYSIIKFAMPKVKVGSIIEYKYTSFMKHYGGLDNWIFQSDIPTLRSCFKLQVLPNSNFSYLLLKKKEYGVKITPPQEGIIIFEMTNLPGLKLEPYMDAAKDYLQRVDFKLSSFVYSRTGGKETFNSSWKELATSLLSDESFGIALNKKLSVPEELKIAVEKETTDLSKTITVFNYLKQNFTWNSYDSKFIIDGLKQVLESKSGSSGELNFLLINFLQAFKIDAKPLLVAERSFGKADPAYIYLDKFNKTVAYVTVDGKNLILDVSQKYSALTLIPYPLLNTYGLLVDKKTTDLMSIESKDKAFKRMVKLNGKIDSAGILKASCSINDYEYAKEVQMEEIKTNKENGFINNYESEYSGLKIENFKYTYQSIDSLPLVEQFDLIQQIDAMGGFALFNYNFFTGLTKNPFKSDVRFTNVNFGYPYWIEIEASIELPENAKTENLVKDFISDNSNESIKLSRTVKRVGNTLKIKLVFKQNSTVIAADSYPALKSIYKSMVDSLNQPIVIKF